MSLYPRPEDAPSGTYSLEDLGWTATLARALDELAAPDRVAGRVATVHRGGCRLYTLLGDLEGQVSGRFRRESRSGLGPPVVGDWVAASPRPTERGATIHAVLPRKTAISRLAAGDTARTQVLAANVDTVWLVCGLDRDFNLRRLERYLVLAWDSGAEPVVVLTKVDLCHDPAASIAQVEVMAPGVAVHGICAPRDEGLDRLMAYVKFGRTVALLGSSGAGKSTLVNHLVGRTVARTGEVRASDGRGRHTTSHRELILLASGGLLVDTPGLRSIQLGDSADGHAAAFDDVEVFASSCRFADCAHGGEPGCDVLRAVERGELAPERLESYERLRRELGHLEARLNPTIARERRQRERVIHRAVRDFQPRG